MKSKLIAGLILAGSSLFAAPRVAVGVQFGAPAYVQPAYIPPCPGPDYVFLEGRWQHRHVIVEHRDRDRAFDRGFHRDRR